MTRKLTATALACLMTVATLGGTAEASDVRTWYVYCEGKVNGQQSAIFSTNFWPHSARSGYQQALAVAAELYIARSPGTELNGCAGIPFIDATIAEHNRARTAELARGIGDAVYFVDMPAEALPD